MKFCVFLLTAGSLLAAGPRLFYSKSFPGSMPPYVQITLEKNGDAAYREAAADDDPVTFHLTEPETAEIFGLADKLDRFKRPLEANLKVAFMGAKTLRYEDGNDKTEVKFNYTQDPDAQTLTDWFERMAESAQRRIDLERTAKYDKLGVVNSLLQLEISMDKKRVVAPEQFLPLLDRVAKNDSYMHTAQARAAAISERIRAAKP